MPIITLTTDHGLKDSYVPSVRGLLLSRQPGANIIDITHLVSSYNIAEAAFILRNCYRQFPEGTIHLVGVDADQDIEPGFILVRAAGQYFIAHDNGLLSLVLEEDTVEQVLSLSFVEEQLVFPLLYIMAPAACQLAEGLKPEAIGSLIAGYRRKAYMRPIIDQHIIRGHVIYIDHFGNAVTNIERRHLEQQGESRKFRIYVSRKEYFDRISSGYTQVPEGEKVCLFGSTGFMEIGINKGNASALLGLKLNSAILIEFE